MIAADLIARASALGFSWWLCFSSAIAAAGLLFAASRYGRARERGKR